MKTPMLPPFECAWYELCHVTNHVQACRIHMQSFVSLALKWYGTSAPITHNTWRQHVRYMHAFTHRKVVYTHAVVFCHSCSSDTTALLYHSQHMKTTCVVCACVYVPTNSVYTCSRSCHLCSSDSSDTAALPYHLSCMNIILVSILVQSFLAVVLHSDSAAIKKWLGSSSGPMAEKN